MNLTVPRSKKPAPEAGDSVLGLPVKARVVLDFDLGDREAGPRGEHRHVSVQLAVEVDRLRDLPTKDLQSAVEVTPRYSANQ